MNAMGQRPTLPNLSRKRKRPSSAAFCCRYLTLALLYTAQAFGQLPVAIQVDAGQRQRPFKPAWNYFGYDEPNYTYTENGRKLIRELVALSPAPVHIRTHFLLATGDGAAGLKWGSTNAYTEDSSGKPLYDWTIVDKILGTYVDAGAIPFVEIGFMPKALSTQPEPYTPVWKPGDKNPDYYIGWTYPPNNYQKWGELIYQWVTHCIAKYGKSEVEKWDWEVWNEPNIGYWHGTPEEYNKLYDFAVAGVKRALPSARVGGPATTGPANEKAAAFLRQFLQHCASGKNVPLDFISFHAKGRPAIVDGHVRMGLSQELQDFSQGVAIVRSFPQFQNLPIVVSEADPEGCAACSARVYPPNAYRNGALYASYEAAAMKAILEVAERGHANLQGILTWAFEFEDQPFFDGFRTLATNGIDKPVLNFFRMAGQIAGDLLKVESSATAVDALATRSEGKLDVLVWNYNDDELGGQDAAVTLRIAGMPPGATRVALRHYRIDADHSNSYMAWKEMGSPQKPSPEQYRKLEAAGNLQLLESPGWLNSKDGVADLRFILPQQGLSLVELSW
jgi:xylan 1,4-beta-xylosidase